jgi:outer membrane lipoprotein-sorting protein
MTRAKVIAVAVGILMMATNVFAGETTPGEIIEKVKATYESMQTYRAEGTVLLDVNGSTKTETSFSILLKKPNLYLISWTQKDTPAPGANKNGAVWSDGSQPYLYMGLANENEYYKMSSDKIALASATGISYSVAFTIPSLFLPAFEGKTTVLSRLIDPKLEKSEQVGEEECYVVSGATKTSKKETFWISRSKYLIVKYALSIEHPEGGVVLPEYTDAQIDQGLKEMGQEVTEENRKKIRGMMKATSDALKKSRNMNGSSMTSYVNISSPELNNTDFQFVLPKSAVRKDFFSYVDVWKQTEH